MSWKSSMRAGWSHTAYAVKQAVTFLSPVSYRFVYQRAEDYERLARKENNSVVMVCLQWVMRNFPEAPVVLERTTRDGPERILQHPVLDLLRKPNPFYSGRNLWAATLMDYFLYGNAFWIKQRNNGGKVARLWWAPRALISPHSRGPDEFISYYQYMGRQWAVEDVVHFRFGLDPQDPKVGMSPLKAAGVEVYTDTMAADWTATLLRNGGAPGIVLTPEKGVQGIKPAELSRMKEYLEEQYTGGNRGKPLVAPKAMKVQSFGFNPQQMDMKSIRRVTEERVTGLVGIPAVVVGLGAGLEHSTFKNVEEARNMAYENCMIPTQWIMVDGLRNQLLLADFETDGLMEILFDLSKIRVLQEDQNKMAERVTELYKNGIITRRMALNDLGKPTDDSDDVRLVPLNMQLLPAGEIELPMPTDGGSSGSGDGEEEKMMPLPMPEYKAGDLTAIQQRMLATIDRQYIALSRAMAVKLGPIFDRMGAAVTRAAEQVLDDASLRKQWESKAGEAGLADEIMKAAETQAVLESFKKTGGAHYLTVAEETYKGVGDILDVALELPDHEARRIVAEGGTRMGLIDLKAQTRKKLFTDLTTGRILGEGKADLIRRIRSGIPAGPFWKSVRTRAEVIARTETKNAQRGSVLQAYKKSGTVEKVRMIDARLGTQRSDADCIARDGQIVSFDEAEEQKASATTHPRCTLDFLPVVR